MGIDLSISEAKKLREVLDYVINWQEDLKTRVQTIPKRAKKGMVKTAGIKKRNAKPLENKKGNATAAPTRKAKAKSAGRS